MRFHSGAVAMMIGTAAHAGTAFDQEITCPVGGEVFAIVSTASCSSRGVRYMNFRPQSSCEFVTKLPVCPSNGLPMFQEFDESQVTYLEKVIETPAYKDVQTLPKWHRAYILAHWMDLTQSDTGFNLLLNAMWNDPTSFVSDPNMVDSMLFEAEAQFARSDRENKPYVAAIVAFGMLAG